MVMLVAGAFGDVLFLMLIIYKREEGSYIG